MNQKVKEFFNYIYL